METEGDKTEAAIQDNENSANEALSVERLTPDGKVERRAEVFHSKLSLCSQPSHEGASVHRLNKIFQLLNKHDT